MTEHMVRSNCGRCGQAIWWAKKAASGIALSLDIEPEKRVILNGEGKAQMLDTYTLHRETCPKVKT